MQENNKSICKYGLDLLSAETSKSCHIMVLIIYHGKLHGLYTRFDVSTDSSVKKKNIVSYKYTCRSK